MNVPLFIQQTLNIFIDILTLFIFLRVILSWFMYQGHPLMRFLHQATEPLLAPVRRALPVFGPIDISPIVVMLLLEIVRTVINTYL